MQIKNKYYPYPVIAFGNDSYDGSEFITDANYSHDAHNITFHLEATLVDDGLSAMVADGRVKYAHHIECQQTCFRTLVFSSVPRYLNMHWKISNLASEHTMLCEGMKCIP